MPAEWLAVLPSFVVNHAFEGQDAAYDICPLYILLSSALYVNSKYFLIGVATNDSVHVSLNEQ